VLNNLRKVEQGAQLRYFGYDSLSRVIRARHVEQTINSALAWTDPVTSYSGGWTAGFSYDLNGNLGTRTDARNITTTYNYDALNRPKTVRYSNDPQNTPGIDRYYDGYRNGTNSNIPNGKGRAFQTETLGQVMFTIDSYDVMGRAQTQRQQFWTGSSWSTSYQVGASYNFSGALIGETYPSGRTVSYAFDVAGRTTSFTGNLGDGTNRTYSSGIIYSPFGGMAKEQFGTTTPVYNKLFYNSRGQLSEIRESTSYTGSTDTSWNRGAIINNYSDQCVGICSGSNMTDNNGTLKKQDV
jgi:YD repeat-containing protein